MNNNTSIVKDIKDKIVSFEADRKKANRKSLIAGIVFLPMALLTGVWLAVETQHPMPAFMIAGFFIGLFALVNYFAFADLKSDFKTQVVGGLIKQFSPHLVYAADEHISKANFRSSKLFNSRITSFKGEDLVYGQIGDTHLQMSELSATKKSGKNSVTVFRGLFIEADFHKYFHSETYIKPETYLKMLGWIRRIGKGQS